MKTATASNAQLTMIAALAANATQSLTVAVAVLLALPQNATAIPIAPMAGLAASTWLVTLPAGAAMTEAACVTTFLPIVLGQTANLRTASA